MFCSAGEGAQDLEHSSQAHHCQQQILSCFPLHFILPLLEMLASVSPHGGFLVIRPHVRHHLHRKAFLAHPASVPVLSER
jgi:hypothetical protein